MRTPDRFDAARAVADAVLYEGYVLYPYRASSRKNQMRFQWGVLTPRSFSEADGSERWASRTECLLDPGTGNGSAVAALVLRARVRCLQTQHRRLQGRVPADHPHAGPDPHFEPVASLTVDGTTHVEWDEAVDRVVEVPPVVLGPDAPAYDGAVDVTLEGGSEHEPIHDAAGTVVGRFVRERQSVQGRVRVTAAPAAGGSRHVKVVVTVENTTDWDPERGATRADAVGRSLVAVHVMLAIDGARFVSLLDPPEDASAAAADCRSDGTFPVLVGAEDVVLASPIILYDHPELSPQSPGDLYDSLEIDEILALRVMTLTDAEKSEARGTDARAAAVIDRCDGLSPEAIERLHGEMRPVIPFGRADPVCRVQPAFPTSTTPGPGDDAGGGVRWWDPAADASVDPWTDAVTVAGVDFTHGSPVRLRPSGRADAQDMFLDGRSATVAGVFRDVDGGCHLAVTLDDDPAAGELEWQGRYYYFRPDELEPLATVPPDPAAPGNRVARPPEAPR